MDVRHFSAANKADMIEIFIRCNKNSRAAVRSYHNLFPDRACPHYTYFQKIYTKFRTTGNVSVTKRQRSNHFTEEDEVTVLRHIQENPHLSLRECGAIVGLTKDTVRKILKKHNFKPYKITSVHTLEENDAGRRVQFCRWYLNELNDYRRNVILWTDECNFTNTKNFNRQNLHYWSVNNEHVIREVRSQRRFSINVWCGIVNNSIIGPYFYEGTLTGDRYLNFLQNDLNIYLDDVPLNIRRDIIFQQDGAPPHSSQRVTEFLNDTFEIWIGNRGRIFWPPRSPDLTPLDFYLWGAMKNFVYKTNPLDLEDLKARITEFVRIQNNRRPNITGNIIKRLQKCITEGGRHIEQFM